MIEKNYTKIPNEIYTAQVSLAAFKLFCYLCSVPDEFKPSITHMTKRLGIPKTTLLKAQRELRNYKMIFVEDKKSFFVKRTTIGPEQWDFSCAKNEHLVDGDDPTTRTTADLGRTTADQIQVRSGSFLGPQRTISRSAADQQVRLKSKTIKQDYKARLNKERKTAAKKPKFSDEDLVAATMWQEYILAHRPKIKVIIEDEATSFAKLRKDFGWDNSFLKNLIEFLIKTKTPDKGDFAYFWYATHLKWFLSLTSDRSQRKAESIRGQVERYFSSSGSNHDPEFDLTITQDDIKDFINFGAVDRGINIKNVTPKPKQLEDCDAQRRDDHVGKSAKND